MINRYIAILSCVVFFVLVSACSGAAIQPMSPQEMQRQLDSITNTAAVISTQNAIVTAQRKATEQVGSDRMTATSFAVGVESTKTREQWTAQAVIDSNKAKSDQATATATAQIGRDTLESKRLNADMESSRQNGETLRAMIYMFALIVAALLITLAVVAVIYWLAYLNRRALSQETGEYIRALETRARATKDTNGGTITTDEHGRLVIITPRGVMIVDDGSILAQATPPALLVGPNDLSGEQRDRIDNSRYSEESQIIDEITINEGNRAHAVIPLTDIEIEDQSRMMYFLRKAMSAHNHAKIDGKKSNRVPGFRDIGLDSASTWSDYADMFGEHLERKRGNNGGTFVNAPYHNLDELLEAVRTRRVVAAKHWKGRKSKLNQVGTMANLTPSVVKQ